MEPANICEEYITLLLIERRNTDHLGEEEHYCIVPAEVGRELVNDDDDDEVAAEEEEEDDDDDFTSETSTLPSLRPPSTLPCCDQSIMYVAHEDVGLPDRRKEDDNKPTIESHILQQLRAIAVAIKLTELIGGVYYAG